MDMWIFENKKKEKNLRSKEAAMFETQKLKQLERLEKVEGKLDLLLQERLDNEQLKKIEKRLRKQENMLEELLEQQIENNEEQKLLDIIMMYEEYLKQNHLAMKLLLKNQTEHQEEVDRQWNLMEKSLKKYLMEGQIQKIGNIGELVDLEQMEIVQVDKTQEKEKENQVSRVIISGWIYKGKIIRKAKVCVYKI